MCTSSIVKAPLCQIYTNVKIRFEFYILYYSKDTPMVKLHFRTIHSLKDAETFLFSFFTAAVKVLENTGKNFFLLKHKPFVQFLLNFISR